MDCNVSFKRDPQGRIAINQPDDPFTRITLCFIVSYCNTSCFLQNSNGHHLQSLLSLMSNSYNLSAGADKIEWVVALYGGTVLELELVI